MMSDQDIYDQARADGYRDGYDAAYQRAISRQQLGLPLELGVSFADDARTVGIASPYFETARTD